MTLPIDFIARTRHLLGDAYAPFEAALLADAPVSIRINAKKRIPAPRGGEPVAWCKTGFYLPERLSFTFDPLFHAGAYYVQEAASMFLEQAVGQYVTGPVRCLDLCAAPGGKSTHLASLLPPGSVLVSNEVIRSRSHILAENLAKWGAPDVIVTHGDPEQIGKLTHLFDLIVADVPCSGEGMFRKDPESAGQWSVGHVALCAGRSRRIIHDVWDALKPGGLLVYSTCTYNTEEDEEAIHAIVEELGAEALPVAVREEWQVTGALKQAHPVCRFFPHKTKGEGFFLALLRKAEGEVQEGGVRRKGTRERAKSAPAVPEVVKTLLLDASSFSAEWSGTAVRMLPRPVAEVLPYIRQQVSVLSAGVCMGEQKGSDFIPSHELALSTALCPDAFPTVELSWEEAIRYLKKESLCLPESTGRGYALVAYKGYPLGFVKQLGNRANNLYPQAWRIRTGYLPERLLVYESGR